MNRILLLMTALLLGFNPVIGQTTPTGGNFFLGIDPDMNFQDLGHDPASLKSDLNPFPLGAFVQGPHELSEFDFDSEIILFNKQGKLDGMVFSKLFSTEEYGSENRDQAVAHFEEVQAGIQELMGVPVTEGEGYSAWSTPRYTLQLMVDQETSVQLFYSIQGEPVSNTSFIDEPFDIEINEKTFTIRNNQDLDAAVVELFNAYLGALNDELVRSFARKNQNKLDIFFEREVDLKPEDSDEEIKEAARILEETLIKSYAEQVLLNVFDSPDDLNLLRAIQVNGLDFKLDMFYGDGSEARVTRSVSIEALEGLQFPLSRRDARDLLTNQK